MGVLQIGVLEVLGLLWVLLILGALGALRVQHLECSSWKLFRLVIFRKLIGFIWRSKDHLEDEGPIWTHLEDQGSFGDEGTFQECQKTRILKIPRFGETENWKPGVYFDAEYVSAHFCRAQTP